MAQWIHADLSPLWIVKVLLDLFIYFSRSHVDPLAFSGLHWTLPTFATFFVLSNTKSFIFIPNSKLYISNSASRFVAKIFSRVFVFGIRGFVDRYHTTILLISFTPIQSGDVHTQTNRSAISYRSINFIRILVVFT